MGITMQHTLYGDVMLLVHGTATADQEEWDAYLDDVRKGVASGRLRALLVYSDGGGPDAKQRKQVVQAYQPTTPRVAICSSSTLARGIMTALTWFYKGPMRIFRPEDFDKAQEFLDIPKGRRKQCWEKIQAMRQNIQGA